MYHRQQNTFTPKAKVADLEKENFLGYLNLSYVNLANHVLKTSALIYRM